MNTRQSPRFVKFLVLAFASLTLSTLGHAAVVINFVNQFHQASGTLAPGTEYSFFNATPSSSGVNGAVDYSSLTNFAVTKLIAGNTNNVYAAQFGGVTFADVIAPGDVSAHKTGIVYNDAAGVPVSMFTFTLTNTLPSFDVWILDDTVDGTFNNTTGISISGPGGSFASHAAALTETASLGFTKFTINGASSGDTFTVALSSPGGFARLVSGITFSAIPEPSTWALLGGSLMFLLLRRRVRKAR